MKQPKRTYIGAYASLRFRGEDLDPSDVTRALRLPPDDMHRRGDLRLSRTSKGKVSQAAPYRLGIWIMSSKEWVTSPRIQVHLQWILDQLKGKHPALAALLARGYIGDVPCFSSGRTKAAPSIPKGIRDQFRELQLDVWIDHVDLGRNEATNYDATDRKNIAPGREEPSN